MATIVRPADRAEPIVRLPADRPPRGRAGGSQPQKHDEPAPMVAAPETAPEFGSDLSHMGAIAAATLADTEGGLLDRAVKAAQAQAEEQIERLREQAREEGHREGLSQGEQAGRQA